MLIRRSWKICQSLIQKVIASSFGSMNYTVVLFSVVFVVLFLVINL